MKEDSRILILVLLELFMLLLMLPGSHWQNINQIDWSLCLYIASCGHTEDFFNALHHSCGEILHLYRFSITSTIKSPRL